MCEASIHVPFRKAQAQERLIVRSLWPGMKGLFPFQGNARRGNKLVCIKDGTKALIKRVMFPKGVSPIMEPWAGKRNVPVILFRQNHVDVARFPNGTTIGLFNIAEETRIDIGIPVRTRKPQGIKVLEAAIQQALAVPPEPKPEDEDEPTEQQEEREKEDQEEKPQQ
jgi:hypothetical protein